MDIERELREIVESGKQVVVYNRLSIHHGVLASNVLCFFIADNRASVCFHSEDVTNIVEKCNQFYIWLI